MCGEAGKERWYLEEEGDTHRLGVELKVQPLNFLHFSFLICKVGITLTLTLKVYDQATERLLWRVTGSLGWERDPAAVSQRE